MKRRVAILIASVALAACDRRKPARPPETASKPKTVFTRAQVLEMAKYDPLLAGFAAETAAPQSAAPDDESKIVLAQTIVEAWIATVEKHDHERAEKELARAYVSVDTSCGNTPACAVERVDAILRARPRNLTYRPIGKGDRVWMNVAVTDFEDPAIASAEIKARLDFTDEGDISIAELGVSATTR